MLLILNAGSSSLKFGIFDGTAPPRRISSGVIDRIGSAKSTFKLKAAEQETTRPGISAPEHVSALEYLLEQLAETTAPDRFRAVGHRVVHGGRRCRDPHGAEAGRANPEG